MNIKAIISLAATLIVGIAAVLGVALDEGLATTIVGCVVIAADVAYACWTNHDITKAAQYGSTFMNAIKDGSITEEEALGILDEINADNQ